MNQGKVYEILYFIFRKDIGRKVMALILAFILWFYLDQKVEISDSAEVPIRVVTGKEEFNRESFNMTEGFFIVLPQGLMLEKELAEKLLTMAISGPKEMIPKELIGRANIELKVMENQPSMEVTIPIHRDQFDVLRERESVEVRSFSPTQIILNLAHREEAQIHLSMNNMNFAGLDHLVKENLEIDEDVGFDPTDITILGPALEIQRIRENPALLKLEILDLKDSTGSEIRRELDLSREMRAKNLSIRGKQSVKVTVNFEGDKKVRELKDLDVLVFFKGELLTSEERAKIFLENNENPDAPDKVNVLFTGFVSQVDQLGDDESLRKKIILKIDLGKATGFTEGMAMADIILPEKFVIKLFREQSIDNAVEIKVVPDTISPHWATPTTPE